MVMEFNLKKILRALLLSTSESLSIKEIQAALLAGRARNDAAEEEEEAALAGGMAMAAAVPSFAKATEGDPANAGSVGSAGEPVPAVTGQEVMKELIEQVPTLLTATQIRDALEAIGQELVETGDVARLVQGPAGFRLAVAPEYADWVRVLRDAPKPLRLSQAGLETLALIAYRQPVTRAEIEAVRGVAVDSALNRLLELELAYVSGRAELPGRPIQYATTDKFLEFCGIRSLEELPATDVVAPGQLNEWIRRATLPIEEQQLLSDADMGLSAAEGSQQEQTEAAVEQKV
jgi:segregation and condensation protein B